jgi:hypothetical protein
MTPSELKLFYQPPERLRLTTPDRSYLSITPVWAAPLSRPGRHLALVDEKGEEVVMLEGPQALAPESRAAVTEELRRRYLTAIVTRIVEARNEFGAQYWTFDTDRGVREAVTQNLQDNAIFFSETRILLLDVDANRFEFPDVRQLDPRSRKMLATIL